MKASLTALLLAVLLSACQKEISSELINGGNGTGSGSGSGSGNTAGLLVKTVAVTGSETQTSLFTYDASQRLYTQTDNGVSGGMPVNSYKRFERDAAGRIVRVVQKVGDVNGIPSDTARVTYHYPSTTTMNPDYSVSVMGLNAGGGLTMSTIDSIVYNYSNGKLASYNGFMSSSMLGVVIPVAESRWDFTYDGSGYVSMMKMFGNTNTGDPLTESYNIAFTYGTLANNMYTSPNAMQNLILSGVPNGTAPVVTKSVANSVNTTPSVNVTITMTFVTSGSKITGGTTTVVSTGQPTQTTNYTFYYQ